MQSLGLNLSCERKGGGLMRILFLGAGPLAFPVFQALCDSRHDLVGLVTQPDKTGPGHHHHANPLKDLATARDIPIFQPEKLRDPVHREWLDPLMPELSVVAAYGQILPKVVLDLPKHGTINVHASLLPKYRGATPIHAAVLNGDEKAGVTIIQLVPKLDAGPMLGVAELSVDAEETTGSLETRLADLAIPLTLRVIDEINAGAVVPVVQDDALATHVGKLTKADGQIDWTKPAVEIERHLRGMQPWPGPFTFLHQTGKPPLRLAVLKARVVTSDAGSLTSGRSRIEGNRWLVGTGLGMLELLAVQPEGKKPMPTSDFLRGRKVQSEDVLGGKDLPLA